MMCADTVRTFAVATLALMALSGPASAAVLVPIAVVIGAGEGLFLPGSFSIIPSLLPPDDLQAGNALSSGGTQLATLIGPALGGVVVALAGAPWAFSIDAASFAVSALTLAGVRRIERPSAVTNAPVDPMVGEIAGGTTGQLPTEPDPVGPAVDDKRTLRRLLAAEPVLVLILAITLAANLGSAVFLGEAIVLAVIPYLGGALGAGGAIVAFGLLNGFGNVVMITAFQRWAPP
jgi:MFS family permease